MNWIQRQAGAGVHNEVDKEKVSATFVVDTLTGTDVHDETKK